MHFLWGPAAISESPHLRLEDTPRDPSTYSIHTRNILPKHRWNIHAPAFFLLGDDCHSADAGGSSSCPRRRDVVVVPVATRYGQNRTPKYTDIYVEHTGYYDGSQSYSKIHLYSMVQAVWWFFVYFVRLSPQPHEIYLICPSTDERNASVVDRQAPVQKREDDDRRKKKYSSLDWEFDFRGFILIV